jgi:DNA-binding transcriptional MerR regulator
MSVDTLGLILNNGLTLFFNSGSNQGLAGGPPMTVKQTGQARSRRLNERRLLTLSEVAQSIEVSMPTAQKYKRVYQRRIPSVGKGRTQRYPEKALRVFEQIKVENLSRRGRPPKVTSISSAANLSSRSAKKTSNGKGRRMSTSGSRQASRTGSSNNKGSELLTLTEISRRTGISYPTCIKYAKENLGVIPHVGSGRQRRYKPEAVAMFRDLRNQSRRGRRKASDKRPSPTERAILERVRKLELVQRQLVKRVDKMLSSLDRPVKVTVSRGR